MVDNNPQSKADLLEQAQMEEEMNKPARIFLDEPFREYVKEKYILENQEEILNNPSLMQMIFALEWYDIPRTSYSDLIEYHPYLTVGDHDKLFYINMQHRIENTISFTLFSLISNRLMFNRGKTWLKKRYVRTPAALISGGLLTYVFNYLVLRPIYLHDIDEMGLKSKYFFLDLNADMMKEDLEQLGIKIKSKHFNKEEIENRLSQQQAASEAKEESRQAK